jgi:cytochrome bd ubiquinol oxidase subunit II
VIFGVAFGNLLQGVPFRFDDYLMPTYSGSFWALLNPFALLAGVVSSAMITLQGATYLTHRTEAQIQRRAAAAGIGAALVLVATFVGAGIWLQGIDGYRISSAVQAAALPDPLSKTVVREAGAWMANYTTAPLLWLLPGLGVAGALGAAALLAARRTLSAFLASSLAVVGVIGTAGASMFPFVMPSSTHLASSLTVWDSVSSHLTLGIMFWATLIFMPLIVIYTSWAYRVMRGKVTEAYIRENDHAAY